MAIVADGDVNRVLLCRILGMPLENLFRLEQNYACINILHAAFGIVGAQPSDQLLDDETLPGGARFGVSLDFLPRGEIQQCMGQPVVADIDLGILDLTL